MWLLQSNLSVMQLTCKLSIPSTVMLYECGWAMLASVYIGAKLTSL
jgi:hypothetical protein